jgi:hypothetical protein
VWHRRPWCDTVLRAGGCAAWTTLHADGILFCVDATIDPPDKWVVVLHHLPYRHVDALWNGEVPGVALGYW